MNFLTFDVVKWGLLIGSLIFCSIQLSGIGMRLRHIDHALTVLTIKQTMPEVFEDLEGEFEDE